jgi:hypothetical protein
MTCYIAFPDFPIDAMPTLPEGWNDVSWRQDVCPCYARADNAVMIWVDYPNPSDREFYNTRRFRVMRPLDDDIMGETDIWEMALAMADAVLPAAPPVLTLV